ncbi:DUF418 domain-containing protein [Kaarinaea lacus]
MTEVRLDRGDAPYVRFVQIDALRGFAVLGIFWINICVFAIPSIDGVVPPELNDDSLVNTLLGVFSEIYIEGTMRGLFSILFGASALIFLDEAKLATSGVELVDRYYRRTLLLVLFGLIHAYLLLWPHDVLYAYGLFGLFLFPLRKLSPWKLVACALVLLLIGDFKYIPPDEQTGEQPTLLNMDIMEEDNILPGGDSPGDMTPGMLEPVPGSNVTAQELVESSIEARTELLIDLYHSGYVSIFNAQLEGVVEKQSLSIYQEFIFDIGGMMLLGMALFKFGLLTGRARRGTYLVLIVAGYVLGSFIRYAIATDSPDPDPGYNLGRMFIALGHIGLVGFACQSKTFEYIIKKLAAVGRMALTNYIMQTLISIFLFYGIGFALYGALERYELIIICISVWIFQLLSSNLWLRWFKHGPLEWLWRSLIYGKRQAFRKIPLPAKG